jgi:hypothetical protein
MSPNLEDVVSRRRALALASAALVIAACPSPPAPSEAIDRWMQCVECDRGELDSVRVLGSKALPRLRDYLLHGPEKERQDSVQRYLERTQDSLAADPSVPGAPLHLDKALQVRTFLGNLDATYRTRAARALQVIGGPAAHAALDSARHLPVRPDVAYAVQTALDSLPP